MKARVCDICGSRITNTFHTVKLSKSVCPYHDRRKQDLCRDCMGKIAFICNTDWSKADIDEFVERLKY